MDGAKQQFVGVGRYQLTCLKNLLVIIINLSILQRSMPNHSRPIVTKKHFMKSKAAFSLPKQSAYQNTDILSKSVTYGSYRDLTPLIFLSQNKINY